MRPSTSEIRVVRVTTLDDILPPAKKIVQIGDQIREAVENVLKLKPKKKGEIPVAEIDYKGIHYNNFASRVSQLRRAGKIPNAVRVIKVEKRFYLSPK